MKAQLTVTIDLELIQEIGKAENKSKRVEDLLQKGLLYEQIGNGKSVKGCVGLALKALKQIDVLCKDTEIYNKSVDTLKEENVE